MTLPRSDTSRNLGNRKQEIFLADRDMTTFLAVLSKVASASRWRCHAYCLMPNHYHLVVETPEANLSAGTHRLNSVYARRFNQRHGFEGHVFQRRFYSVLVEGTSHLIELSRYLALNPVRAGLCGHPGEWQWSSYRAMTGAATPARFLATDWLLSQFAATPERARKAFVAFVAMSRRAMARTPPGHVPGRVCRSQPTREGEPSREG